MGCGNEQPVITTGMGSGDGAGRITADTVGLKSFALARSFQIAAHFFIDLKH